MKWHILNLNLDRAKVSPLELMVRKMGEAKVDKPLLVYKRREGTSGHGSGPGLSRE